MTDPAAIRHHVNEVITAQQRIDAARADRAAAYNRAKDAGIAPEALKEALRWIRFDPDKIVERQQQAARILLAIKAPAQIDLCTMAESPVAVPEQLDRAAREDGYHARLMNRAKEDCPFTGDRAGIWAEGWDEADKELEGSEKPAD